MEELSKEQKTLIKDIFDSCLDNNDTTLFIELIDKAGVFGCSELITKIDYDRDKEIMQKAIAFSFSSWISNRQPKIEYIFGCRDPKSEVNLWGGAFVICKSVGGTITAAQFENNMDYIGHPKTYNDAMISYNIFIERGWLPMSKDDLEKTAGVIIDKDTVIIPFKKNNKKKWFIFGIGSTILTVIISQICKYK